MGLIISNTSFRINGVVSTEKTVLQNLETLCSAAASWLTYDASEGKWAVIINKAGTSVASFNDSNIVGPISVAGTGLYELYNKVRVEFPHVDLNDSLDYITVEIPDADRNSNEPDNTLNIQFDCINNPVQAEMLGLTELKQSRVDKIVTFTTDYSKVGLKAGDLIDITNSVYAWVNKVFRILAIKQVDTEEGGIQLEITALEYDANVYDYSNIIRYTRTNSTGIVGIGAIGTPGTPTVTKFETDRKPYIVVESVAPTGVVEGMEFWIAESPYTTYTLLGTQSPPTGSNVFVSGDVVKQTFDNLTTANFQIKTRGFNSTTTGPFSSTAGFVYTPVQTTDLITQNTQVKDSGVNQLAALAITALLNNLDKLFRTDGSANAAGGLFDRFWDVFNIDTGYDFRNDAGNVALATDQVMSANYSPLPGALITASVGAFTVSGLGSSYPSWTQYGSNYNFTPQYSGQYKIDALFDQNASGNRGGRGSAFSEADDFLQFVFEIYDGATLVVDGGSGGSGATGWIDFSASGIMTLYNTKVYTLQFYYRYTSGSNPGQTLSVDTSWNVYSAIL